MLENIPHLTKSPKTGVYGYRRKIPIAFREWFPKNSELFKRSFKTKDFDEALIELRKLDAWFLKIQKIAKGETDTLPSEVQSAAKMIVEMNRWDPFLATGDANYEAATSHNYDWATDTLEDGGYIQQTHDGWETTKIPDERDPKALAALMMLQGRDDWDFSINLKDVMSIYLQENLKKSRNEQQRKKVGKAVPRLFEKLGEQLSNGMVTAVDDLERAEVRDAVEHIWPNASTRKKNVSTFAAAVNTWNREYPKRQVPNVFIGLVGSEQVRADSKERRSFTPVELQLYQSSLSQSADPEVGLIGMLMINMGCPNGEAQGLAVSDVKLDDQTPHILFRNTRLRIMGKDRLERAVPVVGDLLDILKPYVQKLPSGAEALFPRWSRKDSADLSKALMKHVINKRSDDERLLAPYSARHTFMDRYRSAGVPSDVGKYLAGHKDKEANRVHESYGTRRPPAQLVEHMKAITAVKDWGYFE